MRLNRFFISLFVLLTTGISIAQQPMQFSQYMLNKYQMNPAYAGFDFSLNVVGVYRSQWNNFPKAPTTQDINAHVPLYFLNGAIGINVANERIGNLTNTLGTVSYNYVLETSIGLFSGGLKVGMIQSNLEGSTLRTPDGTYEGNIIEHNDPVLSELSQNGVGVLYGAGVYFIGNVFEGGLSVSRLPVQNVSFDNTKVELKPYLNAYVESNFYVNDDLVLSPSILVRSDLIQVQTDISLIAKLSGNIFGGIGIRGYNSRTLDAAMVIAGWRFNEHYTLSYAYDFGLSSLRSDHVGTHEILLNYNLNRLIGAGLPPKIIYNPRFL